MIPENPDNSQQQQRPQLLTILLILTFLGSGFANLVFLMVFLNYHEMIPLLSELQDEYPMVKNFSGVGRNFFLTGFVLYFFSLIGARLMWNMRKLGFHFYTGAQVMLILLPVVYISDFPFPILDTIFTGTFIYLYYRFYSIFYQ